MKPIRKRSGIGTAASSSNVERAPASGVKRPLSPAGSDDMTAPLRSLRPRRSQPHGADVRPRVALPSATKPDLAAKLEIAGPKASKPSTSARPFARDVPARADQMSAAERKREVRLVGKMWNLMKGDWNFLLEAYRDHCDGTASGPGLVRALLQEIEHSKPEDMKFEGSNVQSFLIRLHKELPLVRALAVGEGIHRRMLLAPSDNRDVLEKLVNQLDDQVRRAAATKSTGLDDKQNRLWKRRGNDPQLQQILQAWRKGQGANRGGAYLVLGYLQGLMAATQSVFSDENHPGISRFKLDIPEIEGKVDLLCRLEDDGKIADLCVVPEGVQDIGYLLNRLKWSQAQGQIRMATPATGERDYKGLVSTVTANMSEEFNAFCVYQKQRNVKRPTGKSFFDHLNDLCKPEQGVVVEHDLDIRRYVVKPHGSAAEVTLLRHVDMRGVRALRVLRNLSEEAAEVKKIVVGWNRKEKRRISPMDVAPLSAGAVNPPSGDPASKAGKRPRLAEAYQLLDLLMHVFENKQLARPLMQDVEKATGVPETLAWSWIKPDGTLKRQPDRLRGYAEWREHLCIQLNNLGDSSELPGPLSTAGLVELLAAYKENKGATPATLAKIIDKSTYSVKAVYDGKYFTFGDDRLRSLPDYALHWQALKEALLNSGNVRRANSLPAPEKPGETFLRHIEEHSYIIHLAISEMQRDSTLDVSEAVQRVTLSSEVMDLARKLLTSGGALRTLEEIGAPLADLDSKQLDTLQQLLGRLQMKPSTNGMVVRAMKRRGRSAAKVFIVPEPQRLNLGKLASQPPPHSLEALYLGNQQLVAKPRSYRYEPEKQVLRWLSTVVKDVVFSIKGAREIQAYWDAEKGTVWLSSNDLHVNRKMAAFLKETGLIEALENAAAKKANPRTNRHLKKLRDGLESVRPEGNASEKQSNDAKEVSGRILVLDAIRKGNFMIPTEPSLDPRTGIPISLHAERRIQEAFQKAHKAAGRKIDLRLMTGRLRPCGACAKSLGLPPEASRGPFWISKSAQEGHDMNKLIRQNLAAGIATTVSKTREGKLDLYANTDSESDPEINAGKQPSTKRKGYLRGEADGVESDLDARPAKRAASSRPSAAVVSPTAGRSTDVAGPSKAASVPPEHAVVVSQLGTREFIDAFIGRPESNRLVARTALKDRVLTLLQEFKGRAQQRGDAYESLDVVFATIQAETGIDIARAVRVGVRAGLADLPRRAEEMTLVSRQPQAIAEG